MYRFGLPYSVLVLQGLPESCDYGRGYQTVEHMMRVGMLVVIR